MNTYMHEGKRYRSLARREYFEGQCQDCGLTRRVTDIVFWVNAMHYRVCADCIKPYRKVILKPFKEVK